MKVLCPKHRPLAHRQRAELARTWHATAYSSQATRSGAQSEPPCGGGRGARATPTPLRAAGHNVYVQPESQDNMHSATITWQWPPQRDDAMRHAGEFLEHLLMHAGPGGLLSQLQRCGWAVSVGVGVTEGDGHCSSSFAQLFQACCPHSALLARGLCRPLSTTWQTCEHALLVVPAPPTRVAGGADDAVPDARWHSRRHGRARWPRGPRPARPRVPRPRRRAARRPRRVALARARRGVCRRVQVRCGAAACS